MFEREVTITVTGAKIATVPTPLPFEAGEAAAKQQAFVELGRPLELVKIATAINAAGGLYPTDGAGTAQGGTTTTITLAADVPTDIEYLGLGVCLTGGAGVGQPRRITAFDTGTRVATVARAWDVVGGWSAPLSGESYVLFIDTYCAKSLQWKAEFEDGTTTIDVRTVLFDAPTVKDALILRRAPRRYFDSALSTIQNLNHQTGVSQGGYYHGDSLALGAQGALGAKLWVPARSGSGKFCLYGGAA